MLKCKNLLTIFQAILLTIFLFFIKNDVFTCNAYTPFEKCTLYNPKSGWKDDHWVISVTIHNEGTAPAIIKSVYVSDKPLPEENPWYTSNQHNWSIVNPIKYVFIEGTQDREWALEIPMGSRVIVCFNESNPEWFSGKDITLKFRSEGGMDYFQNVRLTKVLPENIGDCNEIFLNCRLAELEMRAVVSGYFASIVIVGPFLGLYLFAWSRIILGLD